MRDIFAYFSIGLIQGLIYLYGFASMGLGVFILCKLHTYWIVSAIFMVILALVLIAIGFVIIAYLGKRISEDTK